MENVSDELEQNTSEAMQLQDLPPEILVCLTANANINNKNILYFSGSNFHAFGLLAKN
jgi:hypothetical protein